MGADVEALGYTDELAADTRAAAGRLMTAWGWLHEARLPGPGGPRPTRPVRAVDPDEAEGLARRYRYERAAQLDAIKNGAKPVGEHALPISPAVVEARQRVAGDVAALASRMWKAAHDAGLVLSIRDRALIRACPWCAGTGLALEPDGWAWTWPDVGIVCALCAGRMVIPTGQACQACGDPGPCMCDRSDVVLALSLAVVDELLDLADVESIADACDTLERAAGRAERSAGAGSDRRALPGAPECPVCGSRDLDAEVSSPDRRRWSVRCGNAECECTGPAHLDPATGATVPACPCGIATTRRAGRRHTWPGSLWDGPHGLARLLGATGTGTESLEAYRARLDAEARARVLAPPTDRRRHARR
jgi:hypothetical protein